jgi:hypothetical protein
VVGAKAHCDAHGVSDPAARGWLLGIVFALFRFVEPAVAGRVRTAASQCICRARGPTGLRAASVSACRACDRRTARAAGLQRFNAVSKAVARRRVPRLGAAARSDRAASAGHVYAIRSTLCATSAGRGRYRRCSGAAGKIRYFEPAGLSQAIAVRSHVEQISEPHGPHAPQFNEPLDDVASNNPAPTTTALFRMLCLTGNWFPLYSVAIGRRRGGPARGLMLGVRDGPQLVF